MLSFLLRRLHLLCFLLLLSSFARVSAQVPGWAWALAPGGGVVNGTVLDAAGNVYVVGNFYSTITFGTTTLTSAGNDDIFVAKLTSSGTCVWVTQAGGTNGDFGNGIAVDSSGNVVIAGEFSSQTATFGGTTLANASVGYSDLFVARLTPTGTWEWAARAGGDHYERAEDVAVDVSGNVIVTGSFVSSPATFGSLTLTSAGLYDGFVAKLTPQGSWQWVTRLGSTNSDYSTSVAADLDGTVLVSGRFAGAVSFGATRLTSAGGSDVFVARLTPNGSFAWAVRAGGSGDDGGVAVQVAASGDVLAAGNFRGGAATFGATTLTTAGAMGRADGFVAQLSPAGAWRWATSAGGSDEDGIGGVATDQWGNVFVVGGFLEPSATFGPFTLASAGTYDLFVAKLTPQGIWQWVSGVGGSANDFANSLAVDNNGNAVLVGSTNSPAIAFGATTLTPAGYAGFIARLGSTTGLAENRSAAFTLAPNPAHHTVALTGALGLTATLYDALGHPVRTEPLTAGAATLDVRGLPAGLYVVRAGGATRRLVVE